MRIFNLFFFVLAWRSKKQIPFVLLPNYELDIYIPPGHTIYYPHKTAAVYQTVYNIQSDTWQIYTTVSMSMSIFSTRLY